jgi:hypothetical protein
VRNSKLGVYFDTNFLAFWIYRFVNEGFIVRNLYRNKVSWPFIVYRVENDKKITRLIL